MKNKQLITVGIPAYHAESHICDCLSSIQIQSLKSDEVAVIIASDHPDDNYEFTKERFPDLDITILSCEKNTGPGLARQRALDACKTDWITFIDADDIFLTPFALETFKNNTAPTVIEVQGTFNQEIEEGNISFAERQQLLMNGMEAPPRMIPRNDIGHPWVFGRLYFVPFLKESGIAFSELRAMEDGEFNWKIRMLIDGSPFKINVIPDDIYLWRTGSEHSITRIGREENDGVPLYNWDLCLVGSTVASINAIKFCKKKNPFNGSINRFATEQMISHYFSYVQCLKRKPMFAEQVKFNAKRFYHEIYHDIEEQIPEEILVTMYTAQYAGVAPDMIDIIPQITFFEFMDQLKIEEYRGEEEFKEIRSKLPDWVIELDRKSGVLESLQKDIKPVEEPEIVDAVE